MWSTGDWGLAIANGGLKKVQSIRNDMFNSKASTEHDNKFNQCT